MATAASNVQNRDVNQSTALFNSPLDWNFFGYRICDNVTGQTAENVTAAFKYRGYEIAMSTFRKGGDRIIVLMNHVFVGEYGTVESAIAAVDEMLNWHGANAHGRAAAVRHSPGRRN